MSDALVELGWVTAFVGMVVHAAGSILGGWPTDYLVTWSVPLVGFALMFVGMWLDE